MNTNICSKVVWSEMFILLWQHLLQQPWKVPNFKWKSSSSTISWLKDLHHIFLSSTFGRVWSSRKWIASDRKHFGMHTLPNVLIKTIVFCSFSEIVSGSTIPLRLWNSEGCDIIMKEIFRFFEKNFTRKKAK